MFFKRCDKDGDGRLNYDEFKELIWKNKERKEMEAALRELEEERLEDSSGQASH